MVIYYVRKSSGFVDAGMIRLRHLINIKGENK